MTIKQNEISEWDRRGQREREKGGWKEGEKKLIYQKWNVRADRYEMKYDWYFIAARDIDPYIEIIDWIIVCRL